MTTVDALHGTVQHTHENLSDRLADARTRVVTPGQPRKGYEAIDTFLAIASKHLAAVDEVLLPVARKQLPGGADAVHDYLVSARHLEVVLAHVKARAYGSAFETDFHWEDVWADVEAALAHQRESEAHLADQLSGVLDDRELDELTERLHAAESHAPTRPHPYAPHTGFPGLVARKVLHVVDAFWDTVEGRMAPSPAPPKRKKPGLVAQYFLADPRFDEEEDSTAR